MNIPGKHFIEYLQARKAEELGLVDYDEAIKKRNETVYVPNWFSVDIKTGVSGNLGNGFILLMFHTAHAVNFLVDAHNKLRRK